MCNFTYLLKFVMYFCLFFGFSEAGNLISIINKYSKSLKQLSILN